MKKVFRTIKNSLNEYNYGEILVRDLTKNDSHPPNPKILKELNEMCKDTCASLSIYQMLSRRLHDLNYLLHIEKSLIVVEYLLKNCDTRFIRFMKMQTDYINRLRGLKYMVPVNEFQTVDQAQIVRRRASRIYILLTNDEELEKQRCEAQGKQYVPTSPSNLSQQSSNGPTTSTMESTQSNNNTKQLSQQKIKGEIENDNKISNSSDNIVTTPKKHKSSNRKSKKNTNIDKDKNNNDDNENQNADFIDIYDSSNQTFMANNNSKTNNSTDDLIPEGWLKEFANMPNSGAGENGTTFSFGNSGDFGMEAPFDDQNNEKKNNSTQDSEEWMTQLTNLGNLLEQPKQEKKGKSQGKTLAQMRQGSGNQSLDNVFITPSIQPQDSHNLYTTFIHNQPIAPHYIQQASMNNIFFAQPSTQQIPNQQFQLLSPQIQQQYQQYQQYQENVMAFNTNKQKNDPFHIITSGESLGPVPANYPNNNSKDPFSEFGKLK